MRQLTAFMVAIASCCLGIAAPASDTSIRELLTVMEVPKTVEAAFAQIDSLVDASVSEQLAGKGLSPDQQKTTNGARERAVKMLKAEFTWEKMEPVYVDIYRKIFSQEEIDGMLAFYKTPVGASVVKKMPQVEEDTAAAMEQKAASLIEKLPGQLAGAAASGANDEKKKDLSMEDRVRALDDYIGAGDEPEPASVITPELTKRALEELSRRIPTATKPETKIQFPGPGVAIVSISYTLPDKTAHQQEILFVHKNREWDLTWAPSSEAKKDSQSGGAK